MDLKNIFEIRGHARGGQGMVTAFEIMAKIFSYATNYEVQAFPFFGVERTGAPIQAFLRIAAGPINIRSNIYNPNLVVIFDEGLIEQNPVFDGLKEDGIILINTNKSPEFYKGIARYIYTVPATDISVGKKLGSKSLPIVNAAMIGAILKIFNVGIEEAKEIIKKEVPTKPETNAEAAEMAYNSLLKFNDDAFVKAAPVAKKPALPLDLPTVPYWDKPMSLNKTGNWRVVEPEYVNRQPPCTANCPAGTDVRKFVDLTAESKFTEAYDIIYRHNPFPSVCGRVCPHFCQQNCNRDALDERLNIGAIERFLGDKNAKAVYEPSPIIFDEKIAVIGAGPSGLTAALRLRQMGYDVTVFEALSKAGGMMRTGIPEFRLPGNVLDKEINKIKKQGVKIVLNKRVLVSALKKDYSTIVVAVGSHVGTNMNLPNEQEIIEGIGFLESMKLNETLKTVRKGDTVAVIGGGNTAIDVARTVLRLGGKPIIYYRRTRQEMPAIAHEVEEAMKEGVMIEFLSAPIDIKKSRNGKFNITMMEMKLGKPDKSGRRKPMPVKGSERKVVAEKVIKATGQTYDDIVFDNQKVSVRQGEIVFHQVDEKVRVFCCGDMAWGGTVVEAIGSGNEVAREVDAFLRKTDYMKIEKSTDVVLPGQINFNYYLPVPANHNPFKVVKKLYKDFTEVVQGLTAKQIVNEASRCLHCGDCFNCGNCFNFCPDAAIHIDEENRLRIDFDFCKGCGICIKECPCSAISIVQEAAGEVTALKEEFALINK
jgi:2-oxoacid:acceptor oxidoreductase gamma subunit (pyruvate/2-ketoisovalerate family)/2-oxoacid:acceptor oxidoreductase delta subunit (pyruvate/2-ketoisovalerate family)